MPRHETTDKHYNGCSSDHSLCCTAQFWPPSCCRGTASCSVGHERQKPSAAASTTAAAATACGLAKWLKSQRKHYSAPFHTKFGRLNATFHFKSKFEILFSLFIQLSNFKLQKLQLRLLVCTFESMQFHCILHVKLMFCLHLLHPQIMLFSFSLVLS